jgi:hypothetical protein
MQPDMFLGSGQGAGYSMARWGFVNDALIRAYNRKARSSHIIAPISHITTNINIQAYVDDSHGIIIQDASVDETLNQLIQYNMQTWESLLHAVGGKLEIGKSQFLKFTWAQDNNGNLWLSTTSPINIIEITDSETGLPTKLTEISTSTSYKILGVQMAFDGNQCSQAATFHEKCNTMALAFL